MDFVTEAMLCKVFRPGDGKASHPLIALSPVVGKCTYLLRISQRHAAVTSQYIRVATPLANS